MTDPIDTTLIPPQIRGEGPKARQLYEAALQFEQLLTKQLAQGLTDATQSEDGDDDGGGDDGVAAVYQQQLPDALAKSVSGAGGTGLALGLYRSLGGQEAKR
jgi:Rod binding domain-containing protein